MKNSRRDNGKSTTHETWTKKTGDRKRERSVSVMNNEQCKPLKKKYNTHIAGGRETDRKTHDRTNHDRVRDRTNRDLMRGQAPLPPSTPSSFKGLSHPTLPICSILEPGTPAEQYRKWVNKIPPRSTEIRLMIERWIEHFKLAKERPVALDDFEEEGTEQLVWWRQFLIEMGHISSQDVHHI